MYARVHVKAIQKTGNIGNTGNTVHDLLVFTRVDSP